MKDKGIRRHTAPILKLRIYQKYNRQMDKGMHPSFDLGIAKNYRVITLISLASKIYNALLRNRIEPKNWENTLEETKRLSE